jgi:uncharacterized repeat protein (TIGR01451 family)
MHPIEGENFLGAFDFVTNSGGVALFHVVLSVAVVRGMLLTATAIDSACNTSEFSHAIRVQSSCVYADRALTVTSNAHIVRKPDTLVYRLIFQNNGPDSATRVVLIDALSRHGTFISDSPSAGNTTPAKGVFAYTVGEQRDGRNISSYRYWRIKIIRRDLLLPSIRGRVCCNKKVCLAEVGTASQICQRRSRERLVVASRRESPIPIRTHFIYPSFFQICTPFFSIASSSLSSICSSFLKLKHVFPFMLFRRVGATLIYASLL